MEKKYRQCTMKTVSEKTCYKVIKQDTVMHVQPSRYIHYIQDYIFFFSLFTFAFLSFNEYSWDKNLLLLNLSFYPCPVCSNLN